MGSCEFENWKSELEDILYKRLSEGKKDKILIVGDVACTLYETRNFKECIDLEKWWQEVLSDWKRKNKDITVVCPHPNYVSKEESEQNIKDKIVNSHNTTLDIENAYSLQYFYNLIAKNSNFDDLVNYQQTVEMMKEIKYNFMEEHKNIINTYYSVYSKQLDEIIDNNFNNPKTIEEYSNTYSEINRNLMDNKTNNTTRIVKDIMDKNMDTFLKSIEFAQKFYCDVVQSYCNYIMMIKKLPER